MGLIASSPEIADRLKNATLVGEVTATGNYSYASKTTSGRNYLMAGDACAFIDPVFSTGVYLAMTDRVLGRRCGGCVPEPTASARPGR